jgi:Fibronectin type III domain
VLLATPAGAQSAPPTTKPAAPKTQPTGPGAPTITSVTAGNEKARVTWKASAKQGAPPAAKYEVTPYRGTVAQPPVTVDAPATTATVTGLANKAKYTFKVTAIDAQGATSKASIASKAVTPKAAGFTWYKSKRIWAGGLVVLAALAAGGVFFFRRRKPAPAAPPTPSDLPQEA